MIRLNPVILAAALLAGTAAPALADVKAGVEAWTLGNYAKAVAEWRPLAIKGDPDAQYYMGQAYKAGRGVPVDLNLAEDWYRRAAEKGHPGAENNLGLVMFQNGKRQEALPWIRKSADRGDPRAQYLLGTAMFNGDLVAKDWVQAYALMTRSSAGGLPAAATSLAQMDKFIPVEQRQLGLRMARDMEIASQKAVPGSIGGISEPIAPRPTVPAPVRRPVASGPVARPVDIPPSRPFPSQSDEPGAHFDLPPGVGEEPETVDLPRPTPKPVMAPKSAKVAPPRPQPKAAPAPRAAVRGGWRVQLGAFGEEGRARALYGQLESRVSALRSLQPFLVKAGSITRLQAGPLSSKGEAEQLCGQVRANGASCLPIAP